jgi:hypothetical protein
VRLAHQPVREPAHLRGGLGGGAAGDIPERGHPVLPVSKWEPGELEAARIYQENRKPGEPVVIERPELGDYYLDDGVVSYWQMDKPGILQHERVWFIEDMNVEELFPEQLVWVKSNARQVADFDVQASARLFKMRVYLYENSTSSLP